MSDKKKKGATSEETEPPPPTSAAQPITSPPTPPTSTPGLAPATSGPSVTAPSTTSANPSAERLKRLAEKKAYSELARQKRSELADKTLQLRTLDLDQVYEMAAAAQYDAFDPQLIKARLREKLGASCKRMLTVCLATIYFGNNPYDRVSKVVDPKKLEGMIADLRQIDVVRRKTSSESLTLARIGQAHPVLIMQLRAQLAKQRLLPTNGVSVATTPTLCDLALTPLSDKNTDIKAFITAFAKALYQHAKRAKRDNGLTEEQWLENQDRFRQISVASFANDEQFGDMSWETLTRISIAQCLALLGYDQE